MGTFASAIQGLRRLRRNLVFSFSFTAVIRHSVFLERLNADVIAKQFYFSAIYNSCSWDKIGRVYPPVLRGNFKVFKDSTLLRCHASTLHSPEGCIPDALGYRSARFLRLESRLLMFSGTSASFVSSENV